jgi:hypothetical protein
MRDIAIALGMAVLWLASVAALLGMTVLPWALGLAWMAGWLA